MGSHARRSLLREAFREWKATNAANWAAALAFYTALSLGPVLLIAVAVAGLAFGRDAAQTAILQQIQLLLGSSASNGVATMMREAAEPRHGIAATAIGLATLVFGATGVFSALQDAMDAIWHVQPRPDAGVWSFVKRRFLSFAMVLGVGFLLLVSLVLSAALAALGGFLPLAGSAAQASEAVTSFVLVTLLFAAIFKVLPDAVIRWRDVWVGAAVTAVLFTVGKTLLGVYLGRSQVTTPFGAAGSLALVLLWVYYSSQILFFGAAFTRVYAQERGAGVRPRRDAIAVTTVPTEEADEAGRRDHDAQGGRSASATEPRSTSTASLK